jgi:hypothetical protein
MDQVISLATTLVTLLDSEHSKTLKQTNWAKRMLPLIEWRGCMRSVISKAKKNELLGLVITFRVNTKKKNIKRCFKKGTNKAKEAETLFNELATAITNLPGASDIIKSLSI